MNLIPLIGRTEELDSLDEWLQDAPKTHVVFVSGAGGIGKSRLLEEFYARHKENPYLKMIDPTDFTDVRLRTISNIIPTIVNSLGRFKFNRYDEAMREFYEIIHKISISAQHREKEEQLTFRIFIDDYNALVAKQRVVLMFDTLDALETDETWRYLKTLITDLENTLFILTGREADKYYREVKDNQLKNLHHIPLEPLEQVNSADYLDQKIKQLHNPLAPETRKLLLKLAAGKPILIDLAMEMWLARGYKIPALSEAEVDEKGQSDSQKQKERQEAFEKALVAGLKNLRSQEDKVILTLGHVTELTREGMAFIIRPKMDEARLEQLWQKLQRLVSIKALPNKRITLHDEMKRLIDDFVFPDFDPSGAWRRSRSRALLRFYPDYQENLKQELDKLQAETETKASGETFIAVHSARSYFWHIAKFHLYHALFVNAEQGLELFWSLMDRKDLNMIKGMRGQLIGLVWPYLSEIDPAQRYKITIEKVKYLREIARLDEAMTLIEELSSDSSIGIFENHDRHLTILNQKGNIQVRQGKLIDGIHTFERAVALANEHYLDNELILAELALGWAHRLAGHWGKANDHYWNALDLGEELENEAFKPLIYNNLAHTHSFENPDKALEYCDVAIEIWKRKGSYNALAQAYTNKGALLYRVGRYREAHDWFAQAQEHIYSGQIELSSINNSWQGVTYWAEAQELELSTEKTGLLQEAERLLQEALKVDMPYEKAMNLNRLARVYRNQDRVEEAWNILDEAYADSLELRDEHYQIVNLRDKSEMALEQKRVNSYDDLIKRIETYESNSGKNTPDKGAFGEALINSGLMTISIGQEELGQDIIERGMDGLEEYGHHINYIFAKSVHKFKELVEQTVTPKQRKQLAKQLLNHWKANKFNREHPEAYEVIRQLLKDETTNPIK